MKRMMLSCLLAVNSTAALFAQDPSRIDQLMERYLSKRQFMGSVLLARDDRVLFQKSYGYANLEKKVPNSPTTRFWIGSITKQFTAAAILILDEKYKLNINDPVAKYLPESPAAWRMITIRHLLRHTSGIPDITTFPEFMKLASVPQMPKNLVASISQKPLQFPPGMLRRYSNSGYIILGYLIEKISGQTYQDFISQNIFLPLGMNDSGYQVTAEATAKFAAGYSPASTGSLKAAERPNTTILYSGGGMYSTTEDLHRWEQGINKGKIFSLESLNRMTAPFDNGGALGVGVQFADGRKEIVHGGEVPGFNTHLAYFPDSKVTVAVLANMNEREIPAEIAALLASNAHGERFLLPTELKRIVAGMGVLFVIGIILPFYRHEEERTPVPKLKPPAPCPDTAIHVSNLTYAYKSREVLHGISFSIRRGEIVGLLGPNGAGKSTTLKILAGIQSAVGGKVLIAGYSLPEQQLESKRIVGYLPENPMMYECLSGMEFLELIARLQGLSESTLHSRIAALLKAFDLDNVRISRIAGYSKGMRQKILLSAALLHDPDIILLDEPLSGLDVTSSILVKDLLMALSASGKTVLYSSHVLDVVEKVCDRVIVIDQGTILADAPVEQLKSGAPNESLEVIFRKLTKADDTTPKISQVMEALKA